MLAGGGFVKHPVLSPEMASLAVYHQLHCLVGLSNCLDNLRDGYCPQFND